MTSERSFWAWGTQDRFPSEEKRRQLGEQAKALLDLAALSPQPLPSIESALLPSPLVEVPTRLQAFCVTDPQERVRHTYGKAYVDLVRAFGGDFSAAPDVVALPRNEEEVEQVMEWCGEKKLALLPFGGGTSVVGGVERPKGDRFEGAVSVDLRALNRVLEVDSVSRTARIQAGTLGPQLESQLAKHGFTLRHFPQSFEFSTLGGWLATRAGGHFATLYTHIDDLSQSIRMLTPRGVWQSRAVPASGAGPSPDRMVLGSEGTLGLITEAWMRVQPKPLHRATASICFETFERGVDAARALSQSGLYPTNCRLLDSKEAFLNSVAGEGSSVLIVAFESADHPVEPWIRRALELTATFGGQCDDGPVIKTAGEKASGGEASVWRQAFMDAPYFQSALVSLGVIADTFETACTWSRFPALHAQVTEAVESTLRRVCGAGMVTCRFTHVYPDGPAPYFTFLAPAQPGAELSHWAEIKRAASEALLAAGGTITHHHAVGRTHRPWYDRERPEPFAIALKAAKAALDPHGILNPGVLF
ncbi:MAG: FAD-binding oxidoreductase [Myxococcaceae bacterium]